ncbi:MAG: response regulator [Chitinophagaceae bacterium]|nr:response regulator [Chitinophagaceae bacterium]
MISAQPTNGNLKPLKILLADDDKDDRLFFSMALEALTIPTKLATVVDGEKLMDYLSENADQLPDVIFLDINMPRKNGIECLSEIKQNKKLKGLPVIIFSTSNSKDKIGMVFKNGADVYIHKPSDFSQLKQVIVHALPIAVENIFSNGSLKYILNA